MTAFTLIERYDAWGHKRDHATKTSKGRAARQGKWGTELMKTTPRRRTTGEGRSRLGALLLGLVLIMGLSAVFFPTAKAQAAEVEGCHYGTNGPNASTLCWIDMSSFDSTQAQSPSGQQMSLDIGHYRLTMTAKQTAGPTGLMKPVYASTAPTWSQAVFGRGIYAGVGGKPVIYQQNVPAQIGNNGSINFSNIVVTDINTSQVVTSGYTFVLADAESTNANEGLIFTSDQVLNNYAAVTPSGYLAPCGLEFSGAGTNRVTCMGAPDEGAAQPVGAALLSTSAPSEVGIQFFNGVSSSRQGVAFAVMFAQVSASKIVTDRVAANDNFVVSTNYANSGTVIGAPASTSGTNAASTTPETILAAQNGTLVRFQEQMAAGSTSTLGDYTKSWKCTRNGAAVPDNQITSVNNGAGVDVIVQIGDDVNCAVTNTAQSPKLVVAKSSNPASGSVVNPGQTVAYTVVASNTGNTPLTNVTVRDDLSGVLAHAEYVNGSAQATVGAAPTVSGNDLAWTGNLAVGQSVTLTYRVTVDQDATPADVLVNHVTGTGTNPNNPDHPNVPSNCVTGSEQDCTTTHTPGGSSLSVKKSADPASGSQVYRGQTLTYSVVATNTGDTPLTNVTVDDDLAAVLNHSAYVTGSATASVGAAPTLSGTTLTWTGDLPVDGTVTLTYQVTVNADVTAEDVLVNHVTGEGTNPNDPNHPNVPSNCVTGSEEDCTTSHTPGIPGLTVKKASDPESGSLVNPGQTITYTVVASNTGNTNLTNVTVDDDLAAVLNHGTYVTGSATASTGAAPTVSGTTLTWTGDLAVEGTVTLTYQVTVNDDVTAADVLVNHVTGEGTNPNNPDNPNVPSNCVTGSEQDCTTSHTPGIPGLAVAKSSDPASGATVKPGQTITYTVVARNTGNTDLTNVAVKDDLSGVLAHAAFVGGSASASVGAAPTVSVSTLTWTGDLAVGESVTLTYRVTVNSDVTEADTLVNLVVGSGENPNNPGNPSVPSTCVAGTEQGCTTTHTPTVPTGPSVHTGGEALPGGVLYAGLALLVVGAAGTTFVLARRSRME